MEESTEGKTESAFESNMESTVENTEQSNPESATESTTQSTEKDSPADNMENNDVSTFTKVHTTVSFIVMVFINIFANVIPFNKMTTGEVADFYPNLFAPAGLAFSIWRVIYLMLAAYIIYQFDLFKKKDRIFSKDLIENIGIFFTISSIANTAWIFAWHYRSIGMSLILMAIILVCLIYIILKLKKADLVLREKIFLRLPFSIYFGWITIAAISNTIIFLTSIGWDWLGIPESVWTIMLLVLMLLIGGTIMFKNQDFAYGLSIIWAFIGILIRHTSENGFNGRHPVIIIVLIISIILLLITGVYVLVSDKEKLKSFKLFKKIK